MRRGGAIYARHMNDSIWGDAGGRKTPFTPSDNSHRFDFLTEFKKLCGFAANSLPWCAAFP